jgi:hypothetical protein
MFERKYIGKSIVMSCTVELGSESPLTKAIDRVLELEPGNPDLLFAKSEAHYARMDGETGLTYLKQALSAFPDHFEASMRERYCQNWDNIFAYYGWSDKVKSVSALMLALQNEGNPMQIVRDGLALTLVALIPVARSQFPDVVDCRWKPVWVDTPHGPVFEHYVMLKLRSGEVRKQEMTISPYPVEPPHPRNGNWLIRRACEIDSIFIAFNDGSSVVYNKRYTFSGELKSRLRDIKKRIGQLSLPPNHIAKFREAAQWYMQNSNLDDIKW